jgi:[ribosomal protein S5]-alanine N-acetyltransferase
MFPDQISTSRLTLRRPVEADAPAIFATYAQDPLVCRFLLWRPHTSENTVREFVGFCIAGWESDAKFPYVITEAASSTAIGMIEARPKGLTVDLGYVLARSHWGKGYMPEAIVSLADEAFKQGSLRVQALCDVENRASQRALEKAGFAREGKLERYMIHPNVSPDPRDCFMYAKCR